MKPTVTVIMPVYNVEKYVGFAIESIISQTFEDFKFLIIDDASTDHTLEVINQYHDKRIELIKNHTNIGIANSLNRGLSLANSPYIARMDGDDISKPTRFEKQIAYMKSDSKLSIVGSHMELIDNNGLILKKQEKKTGNENIKIGLFFGNTSLAHPSIMIKKTALDKYHLRYDPAYQYAEDYDLYCRASQHIRFDNYPEALVQYRIHPESVSQRHGTQQIIDAKAALYLHLRRLQFPITLQDFYTHTLLSFSPQTWDEPTMEKVIQWIYSLELWNKKNNIFPYNKFSAYCEQYITQLKQKEKQA